MMAPSPQSGGAVIAKACPDQLSSRYGLGRARRPRFVIDIFYRVDTIKLSIKAGFVHREQTSLSSRYFQKLRYLLLFRTAYINRTL